MVSHPNDFQPASRDLFIRGMRQVASSVGVVTTTGSGGRHGATVSAFSSVSADPPQLLVCLRTASRIASAVHTNQLFCLNILASEYPHVAERFSGRHDAFISDRFDGIEFRQEGTKWVVLKDATAFACEISEAITSGTHTVFVGNVLAIQTSDGQPLTYLQGQYRQLMQDQAGSSASSS